MPKGTKVNAPVYDQNIATVTRWVEEASDGVFTVTPVERQPDEYPRFPGSLVRADGEPFGYEAGHSVPITGVAITLFVPAARKLDNRHTTAKREVRHLVRFAIDTLLRYDQSTHPINLRLANQAEHALLFWKG